MGTCSWWRCCEDCWRDNKWFRMLYKFSWESSGRVWKNWLQFWKKFHCGKGAIKQDCMLQRNSSWKEEPAAYIIVLFLKNCAFWDTSLSVYGMCTATAKSLHLCPTLCDPIDGSPPGSSVPGSFQAKSTGVSRQCLLRAIWGGSVSKIRKYAVHSVV